MFIHKYIIVAFKEYLKGPSLALILKIKLMPITKQLHMARLTKNVC